MTERCGDREKKKKKGKERDSGNISPGILPKQAQVRIRCLDSWTMRVGGILFGDERGVEG